MPDESSEYIDENSYSSDSSDSSQDSSPSPIGIDLASQTGQFAIVEAIRALLANVFKIDDSVARSWAVGGTGTRDGEDTDNAKYYAEQASAITFGEIDSTPTEGNLYPPTSDGTARAISAAVTGTTSVVTIHVAHEAVKATGTIIFTVSGEVTIPSGTTVSDGTYSFVTTDDAELVSGESNLYSAPIEAVVAGASGNADADTITTLVDSISGVLSVTNPSDLTGGADAILSDWDSNGYATATVQGVTATSNQDILPLLATSAENISNNTELQKANLQDAGQSTNAITLYAENVPEVDISMRVIVYG